MHVCRNVCDNYTQCSGKEFPYERGYKFCKTCNVYIKYEGSWCPCCSYKIRNHNRHRKENKWTYESWNYVKALQRECEYKIIGVRNKVIKIEV